MLTTISLVNIHRHTVRNFFLVMRTFKTLSLRNFQIWNLVLLTIVTMLHSISPGLIYFITGSLYLLTIPPPHYPPLITTNLISFSMSLFVFEV